MFSKTNCGYIKAEPPCNKGQLDIYLATIGWDNSKELNYQ